MPLPALPLTVEFVHDTNYIVAETDELVVRFKNREDKLCAIHIRVRGVAQMRPRDDGPLVETTVLEDGVIMSEAYTHLPKPRKLTDVEEEA